jgi:radical SAM protein with 4Fe4S-binding SPASM domain
MDRISEAIKEFIQKFEGDKRLYIYGLGIYGQNAYDILKRDGIQVDGFVMTKPDVSENKGIRVYGLDDIIDEDCLLILGMNGKNTKDVMEILESRGFDMERVYRYHKLVESGKDRLYEHLDLPSLEVTSRIGCGVNCKYCPQSMLIHEYTKTKDAPLVMTFETFKTCMDKLPCGSSVVFAGMAEPTQNPAFLDMLKYAYEKHMRIELFTTLEGIPEEQLDEMMSIPVALMVLHVADEKGYAKITTDETYYRKLEKVISRRNPDGKPYVNLINAQYKPEERTRQICEKLAPVTYNLFDRAGNLSGDEIAHVTHKKMGKLSCSLCGRQLIHNILLPDGRVLMCCMDYGMEHVMGNLLTQPYEEIMENAEKDRVRRAMDGDVSEDVLCRTCTCAVES